MSKTPVSILQEMMVKQKMVPNYELIHDGGGTHMNTFTYRVMCEGLSATGTGRSKRDAKHEAAKAMLETIAAHRGYPQLPASPAPSPVKTPVPVVVPASPRKPLNEPFVNTIGALQGLCAENNLQDPEYIPISDEGPPHARIFTYLCVLSTFKEEGIATTKKQAKHEAAKKMLNRIRELVAVNYPDFLNKKDGQVNLNEAISNSIAQARYPELYRLSTKKVNLGLKISDYHVKFLSLFSPPIRQELLEKLESFKDDNDIMNDDEMVDCILHKFEDILEPLEIDITTELLEPQCSDHFIFFVRLNSSPIIVQCSQGQTKSEAKYKAILSTINTIQLLLK